MKKILFILSLTLVLNANALMLNLKNVDIRVLINTVSMATGKNFLIDPRIKGKVNIISNQEIDDDQLYQIFLTVLKANGFVVIEGESVSRILPKSLTKSQSAYVSKNATDAIVTKIVYLKNTKASQIVPIVRPLMSSYGLLSVYLNSLIIIDTGANIARLEDIISKLDKPLDDDFEFIQLNNTSASQIAAIMKPLFNRNGGIAPNITVDKHNNQLIVSGDKDKRLKVRLLVSELDKNKADSGTTAIIYLKYANAKDILPILQGINQYKSSTKTKDSKVITSNIQANEATNSIIITGDAETKLTIKDIIAKLDVRRAQVLIEAIIAEVSMSDAQELGIQWIAKGGSGVGVTNLNGSLVNLLAASSGNASNIAGGLGGGLNFIAGNYNSNTKQGMGVLINALKSNGNNNILSTPSILTLDNHEAEIVVGQEVPFITNKQLSSAGSNPFQNYERKDVGLKLKVKPQVNDGSSIKLDISQEISGVLNSSSASDLITSKRTLNTSVMVEDGQLLILGGLIDDTWRDSEAKVPLLGDIPLLGNLFKYKTKTKSKSNLMIFIRPTIIKDQILSNAISMEKYNFIKAQQLMNNENAFIKTNFLTNTNYSNTVAPIVKKTEIVTPRIIPTKIIKQPKIVQPQNLKPFVVPKITTPRTKKINKNIKVKQPQKVAPIQAKDIAKIKTISIRERYPDGYLDPKLDNKKYKKVNNSPYYIGK